MDKVLAAHCRADLVTECMKKREEKTLILSGDFRFRFFWLKIDHFRFSFTFRRKWNFIFVGFLFTAENEKCFFIGLQ